jgi:hypothetical protein
MKRRVRKIANFFAFNLLFFALYLNFIHKDNGSVSITPTELETAQNSPAFSGTILVENPGKVLDKKADQPTATVKRPTAEKSVDNGALKLSIN